MVDQCGANLLQTGEAGKFRGPLARGIIDACDATRPCGRCQSDLSRGLRAGSERLQHNHMAILTASNLAKSYGHFDIFDGVSFEIPHQAKIALIGPNGSGKTTLARLILGLDKPTAGTIQRAKKLRMGYLPQHADFDGEGTLWDAMLMVFADLRAQAAELRELEAAMAASDTREQSLRRYGELLEAFELAGGYSYEHRIRHVLTGLGFEEHDLARPVAQLSGGQQTRALLARLLLEEPDLLILDEPTNHLDLAGIEWLEGHLGSWKDSLVVVAHDRAFLDATVDRVWDLASGKLETYRGNYSAYSVQRAERRARQTAEYQRQHRFIAKTEDFIARNIAGQRTRQAQGRQKRLDRVERIEQVQEYRPMSFSLGQVARSGDLVLGLYDLTVGYERHRPFLAIKELELRRGQCVALLGPNGSGKTTLLKTITGDVRALGGTVRTGANVHPGYLAQEYANLDPANAVLDTILNARDMPISEARNLLGRYRFSGDDVFKPVGDLSGGEQARVALAILALQGANLLLLDEPSNHLDIPSQEVLQEVLGTFPGTMLIVTHDRYLITTLAARVWAVEDGTIQCFEEGYQQYRAWQMQRRQEERERPEPRAAARSEEEQARRAAERAASRIARRQAELEDTIHMLEARLSRLGNQLSRASQQRAVERVHELGTEYSEVEAELNVVLADWTDARA